MAFWVFPDEYGRASLSLLYYLLMLKLMFYCLTVIPIQVTFDGGSETPDMKGIQTALRYVQLFSHLLLIISDLET